MLGGMHGEAKSPASPTPPSCASSSPSSASAPTARWCLAFSPVGDTFRVRARRFPGLINATTIDWFHPWPENALIKVSAKFLAEVHLGVDDAVKQQLAEHMAGVHLSVTVISEKYLQSMRRYNYVTPKSYLELIGFYKFLLLQKRTDVQRQIDRLDVGLSTLRKTAADVAELQVDLKHTMVKVEEKKAATDVLLVEMGVQRAGAEKEQAAASIEAEKAGKAAAEAEEIERRRRARARRGQARDGGRGRSGRLPLQEPCSPSSSRCPSRRRASTSSRRPASSWSSTSTRTTSGTAPRR